MKSLHAAKLTLGILLLAAPTMTMPRGNAQTPPGENGGAASSFGQTEAKSLVGQRAKHETDLFTGAFVYSIPIEGAPARNGSQPNLNLVYSSSGENGWCGVGWNLDVGYIERYTKDGVPIKWDTSNPPLPIKQYDDSKGFLCSLFGKQIRLLPYSGNEYRAEVDTDFTRYIFDSSNNRWDVYDKSGNLYRFGYSPSTRLLNPNSGWGVNYTGTFRWALDEIITATGDRTTITYQTHSTGDVGTARVLYPNVISYNGHANWNGYTSTLAPTHTIQFETEARTDKKISYRSGFRVAQDMRVSRITCKVNTTQYVRRYDLGYDYSTSTKRSRLTQVTVFGYDLNNVATALPTQTFDYQEKPLSFQSPTTAWTGMILPDTLALWRVVAGNDASVGALATDLVDIDGDGLPDRVRMNGSSPWNNFWVQRNNGDGTFSATDLNWEPTQSQGRTTFEDWSAINSARTRFVDITGDGRPDRVMDDKNRLGGQDPVNFIVEQNTGTGFSADTTWSGMNSQVGQLPWVEYPGWVKMIDINGDGRADRVMLKVAQPWNYFLVQLGTGTGFAPMKQFGPYSSQGQTSGAWVMLDSDYVKFIDINGDGLPDRVMLPVGTNGFPVQDGTLTRFVVEFNNGYAFEQAASTDWTGVDPQYGPVAYFTWVERFPRVGLFDINGDGLPDRVMYDYQDHTRWYVQLNNGSGFEPCRPPGQPAVVVTGIDSQGASNDEKWFGINSSDGFGNTLTELIDINGDGLVDRVMTDYLSYLGGTPFYGFRVQLSSGPFPDLMKTAINGIGGAITTEYKPSTAWDNRKDPTNPDSERLLPFPIQTVNTVSEADGINVSRTTTYVYEGGFYDPARREFSGFAKVTVTDPPPSSRYKVFYFHQGGGRDYASSGEYDDAGKFAKKGMPCRIETYGNDSPTPLLYNAVVNQVDQADLGGGRWFPFVKTTFAFDYPGGGTPKSTATKFVYDSTTGNLTKKVFYGEVSGVSLTAFTFTDVIPADTQYHQISYATITGNTYIKDHPDSISLTSDDAGTQVVQQTKYTYYANNGSVNTAQKRICAGTFAVETYAYDNTYGNRNLTTDVTGVQTYVESFESTYQIYPASTRQRVTANANSAGDHITTTTYDARSGLLATSTDPMGVQIANTYDSFHRLTQTDKTPYSGSPFWVKKIDYNLGGISAGISANSVRVRNNDGIDTLNGIEAWAYTDGFGRVIEARTEAEQTGSFGWRVVNTVYDERGEILLVTWPRFESGSAYTKPPTTPPVPALYTGFDPAGRVSEKRQRVDATFDSAGKYLSKMNSDGDTTSPPGSPLGARIWQYKNGTEPWWIVATDEENKIRRYRLDGFGRTNRIEEVDGANTYATTLNYDLPGNLSEIINNNSEHIYYGYDDAGTMVAMADPHLGQWTYKHDLAGRLREQTDAKGQKVKFTYNAPLSRLDAKTVYNAAGQLVSTATYTYDTSDDGNYTVYKGMLYKVTDSEGWEKNDYDTRGRLRKNTRHLNVKNQDYTTTYSYNDGDKITSIVYPNSGPTINYSYHPSGSLYQVYRTGYTYYQANAASFDAFSHVTQFSYGNGTVNNRAYFPVSQRLQTITTSGILSKSYQYNKADDVTYISGTSITYDDLHRIKTYTGLAGSYAYDSVGNITTSIEGGSSSYTYGNARKQAVKSAFGKTYLYDLCGNMIVRGTQALDYDAENHLVRLSQPGTVVVEYGYAANEARLWKRKNQTELQVWIGKLYEEKGGKTLFHVFAGDQRVCTFEPGSVLGGGSGGASTHVGYYYHQDHLNSSSALSGSAGQLLEGNTWYAFGSVQTASPQAGFQVSSRFTGQVLDAETGLYYYNARYYDPGLGRFIQPDTIIPDFANPQSYNRYSYVANNPLRYVDPTGHGLLDWIGNLLSYSGPTYLGPEPGAQPSYGPPLAVQYDEIHNYVGNLHPNAVATWSSGRSMALEEGGATATSFRNELGKELAVGAVTSGLGKLAKAGEVAVADKAATRLANTETKFQRAAKTGQNLLNPGINVTERGMQHVLERHIVNGIPEFGGKSKFTTGVNLTELIQQGTQMPMVRQANGNFARTFDAGRAIGIDRATGQATSTVTIITAPNGNLVTMFPGVP